MVSFKHKTQLYFNLCKKQTIFFVFFFFENQMKKKIFSLDIVTFPFKNFVTIATRICFPLAWIVSRIFTRCDCVIFFFYICHKKMNFPCMNLFMNLLCLWLCKLFVTIATRKYLSLPWNLSWIFSGCDCAKFCYNCHKKTFFYPIKYFMNLYTRSKLFVVIATRKCISLSWIFSWIYTTCNYANCFLQL